LGISLSRYREVLHFISLYLQRLSITMPTEMLNKALQERLVGSLTKAEKIAEETWKRT